MAKKDILVNGIIIGTHECTGDSEKDLKAAQKIIKEKGLGREVTTNDSMFGQANSFADVANKIYEVSFKKSPYKGNNVSPFVVNATFSVELYLKTIHNAYRNTKRGHHLANIYKSMPNKGKAFFASAAKDVRPLYELESGVDIHACLESLSQSFEQWRYIYEHNDIRIEIQSIRYAMQTSFEACCRVREDVKKHNKSVKQTV